MKRRVDERVRKTRQIPIVQDSEWDVFISHASEDKECLVQPLANALRSFGLRVWYDEFSLKLGDSLSRSIDKGLASSKFGVVVLSPAFLAKQWPEYELRGLIARDVSEGKVMLPVWHQITRAELLKYSPPLADKVALNSEGRSVEAIAVAIIETVKPDLQTKIHRRIQFLRTQREGHIQQIEIDRVRLPPIRHKELPDELLGRIRLIRAALLMVYPHSMDYWADGLHRDSHPSREISVWERIASVVQEYLAMTELKKSQIQSVFDVALGLSLGHSRESLSEHLKHLPPDAFETLERMGMSPRPPYDFSDPALAAEEDLGGGPDFENSWNEDRELFPSDLPNHVLEGIMIKDKMGGRPGRGRKKRR
jgi:hypothetical protein